MSAAAIASVHARVNPLTITLESRPQPQNGLQGRLSFQHAMAAALVDGDCLPAQFTDERVRDPVISSLRRKIEPVADASIAQHQCELSIRLVDGRILQHRVEHATGTAGHPMTDAMLDAKFRSLLDGRLPAARIRRLLDLLWHLDAVDDIGVIMRACRITP